MTRVPTHVKLAAGALALDAVACSKLDVDFLFVAILGTWTGFVGGFEALRWMSTRRPDPERPRTWAASLLRAGACCSLLLMGLSLIVLMQPSWWENCLANVEAFRLMPLGFAMTGLGPLLALIAHLRGEDLRHGALLAFLATAASVASMAVLNAALQPADPIEWVRVIVSWLPGYPHGCMMGAGLWWVISRASR